MPFYEIIALRSRKNREGEPLTTKEGLFCKDKETARKIAITLSGVNRKHPEAIVSISEISEEEYVELKCSKKKDNRRYFEVIAKGGHVGRDKYYECHFFVCASSWQNACSIVRKYPRVKKDHIDAILQYEEITLEEFVEGSKKFDQNPYFHCNRKGQQLDHIKEIKKDIHKETERVLIQIEKRRGIPKKKNNGDKRAYNRASTTNKPIE